MRGHDGIPRKVSIVVSDNGNGKFDVYMEGDLSRIGKIPNDELSTAEFWAAKLFNVCIDAISQTTALQDEGPRA